MKIFTVVALLFAIVAAVVAAPQGETNAARLARGLPPLPPMRRGTPAFVAKRTKPSSTPSQCNTGSLQCCQSVQNAQSLSGPLSLLLGLLGIVVKDVVGLIGVTCSPLSVIGVGGNSCTAQPVCCTNNSFNGLVALGCSPINLNL